MPNLLARCAGAAGVGAVTLAMTVATALAAASGGPGEAGHGGGGLPQFNAASFPTQLFWLAITMAVLYRVLSRRTLPHLVMVLDRRQQVVTNALRDAAAFKEEAEALLQAAEAALASARESARERTDGMARELAEANAGHLRRFDEEMAAHLAQSRQRIEAARSRALADVRAAGAALADEIAGRLVGVRLTDASDADARGAGSLERIH